MVSPATTARIVAKAIARMKAKKTSPAEALRQQRRAHVDAAVLGDEVLPTIVAAPKPRNVVMM